MDRARMIRLVFVITCLLVIGGLVWAGVYARKRGFTESWRQAIEAELAQQGYYVDIGKLTLGAFRGLVAEDVRFFRDDSREAELAILNDIYLDVDLQEVWRKRIAVNTLDVKDGRLTIPLPETQGGPTGELTIYDLSARVALTESLVEIVRCEAMMGAVRISLNGSLLRAPNTKPQVPMSGEQSQQALAAVSSQMQAVKDLLDRLKDFQFVNPPELTVDIRGDLRDLSTTTAKATLKSEQFWEKGSSYTVESVEAYAEYEGRIRQMQIPRLRVVDRVGTLEADGHWDQGGDELSFNIDSDLSLADFLQMVRPIRQLDEVVFYQPPLLKAKGSLDLAMLRGHTESVLFPGSVQGEFQTERFVSSGVIFNSSRCDFSLRGDSFYLRNLRADHKSGVAFLNCIYEPGRGRESLQFQSQVMMDPAAFLPFVKNAEAEEFLTKWQFRDNSGVNLKAAGKASSFSLEDLQAKGFIDLRDFRLNGIAFEELEADIEVDGSQRWYRSIRLEREDGTVEADLAHLDTATRMWQLENLQSTIDLWDGLGAFSPWLRGHLEPYRFAEPPVLTVNGTIDGRTTEMLSGASRKNDLSIDFASQGPFRYPFYEYEILVDSPQGQIRLDGDGVHLQSMQAGLCGGTIDLEIDSDQLPASGGAYRATMKLEEIGLRSFAKLFGTEVDAKGSLNGHLEVSAPRLGLGVADGNGRISVASSDVLQIPLLAGLGELLPERTGELSGRRSTASFVLEQGVFSSTDLLLLPLAPRVKGSATVDFPNWKLDVFVKDQGSGQSYQGSGDLDAPEWRAISPGDITAIYF